MEVDNKAEGFGRVGCSMKIEMEGIGRLTFGLVFALGWS